MKRIISLLLVFTMMVGILPTQVLAEEFFSEESFSGASHHDETFFEDEDFSAFFSDVEEEDLGALFEEPAKAEDRAADGSDSAAPVEESFAAEAPAGEASALEESFSEDLFGAGTEFVEEPETVPAEDLEQYEVAPEETGVEAADVVQTEETVEATDAAETSEATAEAEATDAPEATAATDGEATAATEAAEGNDEAAEVEGLESRDVDIDVEDLDSRAAIQNLRVIAGGSYIDKPDMHIKLRWDVYDRSKGTATQYRVRYSKSETEIGSSTCSYKDFLASAVEKYDDELESYCEAVLTIPYDSATYWFAVLPIIGSTQPETISNTDSWFPRPVKPANFSAQPKAGVPGTIKFFWKDLSSMPIDGFLLYEGSTLKTSTPIAKTATGTELTGYTTVGKTYIFTLYTYIDENGNNQYNEGVDILSEGVSYPYIVPVTAPIINKATNVTTTSVELKWTSIAGVSGYRIYYYEEGEEIDFNTWTKYVDVTKATTDSAIIDTGLVSGHFYKFVIRAYKQTSQSVDDDGNVEYNKEWSDTSLPYPANATEWFQCLPGIVIGTSAVYNTTSKTISIEWMNQQELDPNINGYAIYYAIDDKTKLTKTLATRVPPTGYLDKGASTYTIASPTLGRQYYFLIVAADSGNEGVFEDAVIFPQPPVEIVPEQVTELKAVSGGYNGTSCEMILTWKIITGVTGYKIQRSTKPFEKAVAADISTFTVTPDTTTTYTDTGLTLGQTYYYRVLAYVNHTSGTGTAEGAWSDVVSVMGSPVDPTLPTTSLKQYATTADLAVTDCGLEFNWNKVNNVDGYKVSIVDAFTNAVVQSDVDVAGGDNTTHVFKNLRAGEPYYAIVKSYIKLPKGEAVSPGRMTKDSMPGGILAPALWVPQNAKPYNFTIEPVDETSVKVLWPAIQGVTGYYVNVKADTVAPIDGAFKDIVDQKVTNNSYTITGMKTGYKYIVSVASYSEVQNTTIRSDRTSTWVYSPPAPAGFETIVYSDSGITTLSDSDHTEIVQARPKQVTGLKLKMEYDADGNPFAQLTWKKVPGLDALNGGYRLYRNPDFDPMNPGEPVTLKGEDTNAYKDDLSKFTPGQKLTYYVCSYVDMLNSGDYAESKESAEVSEVLGMKPLKLEIDHDATGKIVIKWKVPDWMKTYTNISFYVYRAKGTTKFTKAAVVSAISPVGYDPSGEYSVTDTTLTVADGKKYYYWVVPIDKSTTPETQFTRSSSAKGMVSGVPVASLSVKAVEARRVTLEWPVTAGVKGYVIYSSADNGTTWKKVKSVSKKKTSYTVKKLAYHQEYQFAVSAKYKGGALSQKRLLTTPVTTAFSAVVQTNMTVKNATSSKLSWTKVPDATGYYIGLFDGIQWKNYSTKKNKITIKDLEPGKQYDYYVYPYIKWKGKIYPEADVSTWLGWVPEYKDSTYRNATPEAGVYVAPKAPSTLKISKVDAGLANISWKEVSFSGGTVQYRLEYSADGVSWTKLIDKVGSDTQYSMLSPLYGTYYFRVTPFYVANGSTYFGTPRKKKATL